MTNNTAIETLQRKIADLTEQMENANAQLKIESSLERVRTAAMAMKEPADMLAICKIISHELAALDVMEIRNVQTAIFCEDKGSYMNYEYYAKHDKLFTTPVEYNNHPIAERFANQMLKGANQVWTHEFKGAEVKDWLKYQRSTNVFIDTFLETADSLNYYWYSLGPVALGISTYAPLSQKQINLFKKFRNVFELAYRRYIDIEKALAQAREAQIEAALERIRARTMGMHNSNELAEVATLLFEQVKLLGIETYTSGFNIWDKEHNNLISWMSNPVGGLNPPFEMPIHSYDQHKRIYESWNNHESFMEDDLRGDALARHYKFLRSFPLLDAAFSRSEAAGIKTPNRQVHNNAYFSNGYLLFITLQPCPEAHDIFKRFAKVFDQTYTRFLDLQKAEEQAREARIEAALEKVRSKTMAMQRSSELAEVATILFQQVKALGVPQWACGFGIFEIDDKEFTWYQGGADGEILPPCQIPLTEHPVFIQFNESRKRGDELYIYEKTGEVQTDHYRYMCSLPVLGKILQDRLNAGIQFPTFQIDHIASFSHGNLVFITYEPFPEMHDVFKRFAKVFDQTYTRFLDLQKAEAQAMEARIEAALEKVRSRSLAVHKSDEFTDVINVVFEKLQELEIPVESASINIFIEGSRDIDVYACGHTGSGLDIRKVRLRYFDHPIANDLYNAHKNGLDFFVGTYGIKEKNSYYQHQFEHGDLKELPAEIKERILQTEQYMLSTAPSKNSIIIISNFDGKALSETQISIQKRFAKVFEQAYIRFLDLQKAEAQARESQIQLALERVRARTMAMQHSDELAETAALLFKQINDLGIQTWTSGFNIWKNNDTSFIGYNPTPSGGITPPYQIPSKENRFFLNIYEAKKRGEDFFVFESAGESLAETYLYMKTLPVVKEVLKGIEDSGIQLPTFQINHCTFFAQGFLLFITLEPHPEMHDIFKRFGKVFEQTYTRFLDLQKSEAQARESQIQLALERVRARTMAMQKSDELPEASLLLFQQVKELGETTVQNSIAIVNEQSGFVELSTTVQGHHLPRTLNVPIDDPYVMAKGVAAWKSKRKSLKLEFQGQELKDYNEHRNSFFETKVNFPEDRWIVNIIFFSKGWLSFSGNKDISDETFDLLKRFTAVFEQTYIRFNDLKQAEAQTREAQIETALEKVRSRTMGMQKSEELKEVIQIVYEQFVHLNILVEHAGFITDYKERDDLHIWLADQHLVPSEVTIPCFDSPPNNSIKEAKEKGQDFFEYHLTFEEKNKFYQDLFSIIADVPQESLEYYFNCPGLAGSGVLLENVGLYIENFSAIPYTDEENKTLMRFGKVFQQTYTRFLDLQKAEAQAREGQIQLALERIRARTMAMQKSNELQEVVNSVYEHLNELEVRMDGAAICTFIEGTKDYNVWIGDYQEPLRIKFNEFTRVQRDYNDAIEKREELFTNTYSGEIKKEYIQFLLEQTVLGINIPEEQKQLLLSSAFFTTSLACTKNTVFQLYRYTEKSFSKEENDILKRFANVFEQSYTRFLDLQKAEGQAREAQIETAMERIRARAMAMHTSGELIEVANVLREQMGLLNQPDLETSAVLIYHDDFESWDSWYAFRPTQDEKGKIRNGTATFSKNDCALTREIVQHFQSPPPDYTLEVSGEKREEWLRVLMKVAPEIAENAISDEIVNYDTTYFHFSDFQGGSLLVVSYLPPSAEIISLQLRAASVFDLAYRRFRDLQKAEAQAREAQIEAALEKVRAKVMAMKTSNDLNETSLVFGDQLRKLGIEWQFSYFWLIEDNKDDNVFWITWPDHKTSTTTYSWAEADESFRECLIAWEQQTKIHATYVPAQDVPAWLDTFERITKDAGGMSVEIMKPENFKDGVYYYDAMIKYGSFGILTNRSTNKEEQNIQIRFATEFERAYTRFLDLQRAEAQAREATIEVALERVRARALAMQEPEELKDVAQVLRNEMGVLGIEELETCSIYIHEKDSETAECWYALKDPKENEKKMVADHFHLELNETWVGREMKKFYGSDEKQTSIVMQGANRKEWINYCYKHSPVFSGFYGETIPDRTYHLYKFSHGYIGAAAPGDISAESWRLLSRAASVFSLAYSRFKDLTQARNDLIKLKEEKTRAEDALSNLKATQTQLVQSEKMASLGELTAGIAHEIQNPLNFVNNFSDVSNELLEEMKQELTIGNTQSAIEIVNDVKDNLEKILHHGKRADAIVKSMLQHSRSSGGKKELTDINALAEEYFRLAYHGLRAKDKSFNAKFETDLDKSIDKINVVPQEMGRVILNLINNAFYAVNEKRNRSTNGYDPIVVISTKKAGNNIEIKVKDNGDGIPKKVLDKIFQPFFTTKPTGQGTGLGLSLSYDIVTKGHGGELRVETQEGEGSEFIISIPTTN